MTTTLSRLWAMGYRIEAEGEALAYRWTGPGDPPEEARTLLSDLSIRKEEALDALRAEADRPPEPAPSDPLPGYPFAIRSRTLDTEVWIIPDGWPDPVPGPAYTHAEVAALARQGVTGEALRKLHQVRETFDGQVLR